MDSPITNEYYNSLDSNYYTDIFTLIATANFK